MQTAGYRPSQNTSQQRTTPQRATATKRATHAFGGNSLGAFAAGPTNSLTPNSSDVLSPGGMPLPDQPLGRLAYAIYQFDRYFRLPDGPRSFAIFMIALVLVVAGMIVQVLLSAQILQAEARLQAIQKEHQILQQQNSEYIWQIARETNLQRAQARVADQGYRPVLDFSYIVLPGSEISAGSATETSRDVASTVPDIETTDQVSPEQLVIEPASATGVPSAAQFAPDLTATMGPAAISAEDARQVDAPIDRWLDLLLARPNRPTTATAENTPQTEPPGQWWKNVWQQTLDRTQAGVQTVQSLLVQ